MPSLEYVVRPYTSPNAQGQIIIPSTPVGTRERATLTWGAKSTMPTPDTGVSVTCCSETQKEDTRESERHRIYQNDDKTSPNWVDVDRPMKMSMKKGEKNDCIQGWDQMSGVAAAIDGDLAQWADDFAEFDGSDPGTCASTWTFNEGPGKITATFR